MKPSTFLSSTLSSFWRPTTSLLLPLVPLVSALSVFSEPLQAAEPRVVKEIHLGGAKVSKGATVGNTYIFPNTGDDGEELWISAGTVATTELLVDINEGTGSSAPSVFVELGNGLVAFQATDGESGREPWISDGTVAGTKLMFDVNPDGDSNPHSFIMAGGAVYFIANDGTNGAELWRWENDSASRISQLGAGSADGFTAFGTDTNFPRGSFGDKVVYGTYSAILPGSVIVADSNGVTVVDDNMTISLESNNRVPRSRYFQQLGDGFCFIGQKSGGTNLYFSNGSVNNLTLLKEDQPSDLIVWNDIAYFAAQPGQREPNNANNVRGLWRSDGTVQGTQVVSTAMNPSLNFYGPLDMTPVGDRLYFAASVSSQENYLWYMDTEENAERINQVFKRAAAGDVLAVSDLSDVGGELWFFAGDQNTIGKELWRLVDGTTPTMFDEILPGNLALSTNANKVQLSAGNDRAFFVALDEEGGEVIYGAQRGVDPVSKFAEPSVGPGDPDVIQIRGTTDGVIFKAIDPVEGERIWFSDGTEEGTIPILDPKPGINDAQVRVGTTDRMIFDSVQIDRRLFVFLDDGHYPSSTNKDVPIGTEPYRIDLDTPDKTPQLIVDTQLGSVVPDPNGFYRVGNGMGVPGDSTVLGTFVYFRATDGALKSQEVGTELYRSNGVDTVELVADIIDGSRGSRPTELTALNGKLVFYCTNDLTTINGNLVRRPEQYGTELWTYDPSLDQVSLLKDINPNKGSIFPNTWADGSNLGERRLIKSGDHIYFPADNGSDGMELWRTDGTEAGTVQLSNLNGSSDAIDWTEIRTRWAAPLHGGVVFAASNGSDGEEPWIYDGEQVRQLLDINPGSASSEPDGFLSIGNWCYFAATDPDYGRELWRTNGLVTERISDADPGPKNFDPIGLTRVGQSLVFIGHDGADRGELGGGNPELWEYDGIEVKKVWESQAGQYSLGFNGSSIEYAIFIPDWVAVGNKLFFTTSQNFARGNELYVYETNGQLDAGSPGRVELPDGDLVVNEGSGTLETQIFVSRIDGDNGPISVRVRSADGSATAGTHYQAIDQVLTWGDADTSLKSITVTTFGDSVFTRDRDFTLELSEAAGGARIGTATQRVIIREDDPAPVAGALRFASGTIQTIEGDSGSVDIEITVTRRDGSDGAVSVQYATSDGSAIAGSDYTAASGTLSWTDGDDVAKTFVVTVNGDTEREFDEVIHLTLRNPTGDAIIAQGDSRIIILSDELPSRRLTIQIGTANSYIEVNQGFGEVYKGYMTEHDINGRIEDGDNTNPNEVSLDLGLESSQDATVIITDKPGNG